MNQTQIPNAVTSLDTFDNTQAFTEGWALFNDGEIQRLDSPSDSGFHTSIDPVFESDDAAIQFVFHQAMCGSAYHKDALRLANIKGGKL